MPNLHQPGKNQSVLLDILHELTRELDADAILQKAVQSLARLGYWPNIGISVLTPDGRFWQTRASAQYSPGQVSALYPLDSGVIGRAYRTGQLQHIPDIRLDPDFITGESIHPAGSELAVPIRFEGQALGVLNLESPLKDVFTQPDIEFAVSIADAIAIALKNAQRFTAL
ncbi:MAG: GAF domain-containing protein, partial [Chloroflexota bacterium]